ncbi:Arylsulfatase [Polystyrenella longa]|uniref:Arylsulfatase n=1 Tax=Polystyrenella longa TaxID=2528007 RepID=A0A518CM85_9PLAN|nr:sulfatase-like hydrolase/transferase [Polystyrenella longa]QDU80332.1 Arylsulfatase [Polystyrenella longa]
MLIPTHQLHTYLTGLVLTFILSVSISAADESAEVEVQRPPNILLITADNLGYGDLGCYGNEIMQTPHLDQLAREGMRCTSFYTASPTCTVSRATLLTGRYPQRIGLNHQLSREENYAAGLSLKEKLIPEYLKPLGYRTACFGKWNIGFGEGYRPTERGFDTFFGFAAGNIDYYRYVYNGRHDLWRNEEEVFEEGYSTDLFADAACEYIEQENKRPFFIYLPFNAPHFPSVGNKQPGEPNEWQAPVWAFEKYNYDPDTDDPQQRYRAVVTALDAAIGRVLQQLETSGVAENTLVIWYSDNGAFMLKDRGLEVSTNHPLREGGVTLWEGGIRVPCIIRFPGEIKADQVMNDPFISLDLLPTLVQIAGGSLKGEPQSDGQDVWPLMTGVSSPKNARPFFFEFRQYSALRQGKYKIIREKPTQDFQLFDLTTDLAESKDLSRQQPSVRAELVSQFEIWKSQFEE